MRRPTLLHDDLEPAARGRRAFWQGRPITVNPLIGHIAREWTEGWKGGLAELAARIPQDSQDVQTLPDSEQRRLLSLHCPEDLPPLYFQTSDARVSRRA